MEYEELRDYYLRDDILQKILLFSKNREVALRYTDVFGKRPYVIENKMDLLHIRKKLPTSFHCSEERWLNPHLLGTEKNKEERDNNRIGWDLILDLDGVSYEYAKIAGDIILRYLIDELHIQNTTVKFSGNKGFHIGIPYESFITSDVPDKYGKYHSMSSLFPELAQYMALYITEQIKNELSKKLIKQEGTIEKLSQKWDIPLQELVNDDSESHYLNFLKLIEIDTILITSRHLFRMPYSLHEKSGLASIPINPLKFLEFDKFKDAHPQNVDPQQYEKFEFLRYNAEFGKDGRELQIRAIEFFTQERDFSNMTKQLDEKRRIEHNSQLGKTTLLSDVFGEVFEIEQEVNFEDFSPVIKEILQMDFEDGKKRALFVLLTFLYSIKWSEELIKDEVNKWNSRQTQPLKEQYIQAQLHWFSNQDHTISPPNYTNENYYKNIGLTQEKLKEDMYHFKNKTVKNPLHYVYLLLKTKPQDKTQKKTVSSSKKK
ncbi:MAG: DNA primase small subunit domain-containing protein [Candidatus Nanoarchaeia archaeon]